MNIKEDHISSDRNLIAALHIVSKISMTPLECNTIKNMKKNSLVNRRLVLIVISVELHQHIHIPLMY